MKLEISSLSFSYGSKEILRNVSFSLESGRSTALLGRNGSGKTTLLRIILGFLKPACGSVSVDGKEVSKMNHRERAKFIAYIPQTLTDIYPYTALETVLMGRASSLSLFQHPGKKDEEKALEALEILGIAHLKNRAVNTLSGGERQLVLIARAIVQDASFMIMDEPTASLDYSNSLLVMEKIEELRQDGYGILYSTHSPDTALQNGLGILLLSDGVSEYIDNPEELEDGRKLSELYSRQLCIKSIETEKGRKLVCVPV